MRKLTALLLLFALTAALFSASSKPRIPKTFSVRIYPAFIFPCPLQGALTVGTLAFILPTLPFETELLRFKTFPIHIHLLTSGFDTQGLWFEATFTNQKRRGK